MDGGLRETGQPRKVNWESLVGDEEEGGAAGLRSASSFRLTTSASAVVVVDDDDDEEEEEEDETFMALAVREAFLRVEGWRGGDAEGSSLGGRVSAGGGGFGFLSVLGGVEDVE